MNSKQFKNLNKNLNVILEEIYDLKQLAMLSDYNERWLTRNEACLIIEHNGLKLEDVFRDHKLESSGTDTRIFVTLDSLLDYMEKIKSPNSPKKQTNDEF